MGQEINVEKPAIIEFAPLQAKGIQSQAKEVKECQEEMRSSILNWN